MATDNIGLERRFLIDKEEKPERPVFEEPGITNLWLELSSGSDKEPLWESRVEEDEEERKEPDDNTLNIERPEFFLLKEFFLLSNSIFEELLTGIDKLLKSEGESGSPEVDDSVSLNKLDSDISKFESILSENVIRFWLCFLK